MHEEYEESYESYQVISFMHLCLKLGSGSLFRWTLFRWILFRWTLKYLILTPTLTLTGRRKMRDWNYRHHQKCRGGKCGTGIIGTKLQGWKIQEQAVMESQNTCGTGSVARSSYLLVVTAHKKHISNYLSDFTK